jgi:hypothetical protein
MPLCSIVNANYDRSAGCNSTLDSSSSTWANPLVEREHPKFGNTGRSASDDHSANVPFKERPPWAQMFTFSGQTLAPSFTSASSLPGPDNSGDGRHFEPHNNERSSIKTRAVWRRVQVRPWAVMVSCALSRDGTNWTCSYPGLRERTGTSETSRDIEEEKARVFTNVSMLSR